MGNTYVLVVHYEDIGTDKKDDLDGDESASLSPRISSDHEGKSMKPKKKSYYFAWMDQIYSIENFFSAKEGFQSSIIAEYKKIMAKYNMPEEAGIKVTEEAGIKVTEEAEIKVTMGFCDSPTYNEKQGTLLGNMYTYDEKKNTLSGE